MRKGENQTHVTEESPPTENSHGLQGRGLLRELS